MERYYPPRIVRELSRKSKADDARLAQALKEKYALKNSADFVRSLRHNLSERVAAESAFEEILRVAESEQGYLTPHHGTMIMNLVDEVYYHSIEFFLEEEPRKVSATDDSRETGVSGVGWRLVEREGKQFVAVHESMVLQAKLPFSGDFYEWLRVEPHYEEAGKLISYEIERIDSRLLALIGGSPMINIPKNISANLLHYTRPGQPTLYEQIEDRNLAEKVRKVREEGNIIIEGIKLTVPEDRLLKAIYKLINKNKVQYVQKIDERSGRPVEQEAIIKTSWSEIYEAYDLEKKQKRKQFDYPSSDVETVQRALDNLARKKFLMTYKGKEGTLITYGSLLDVEIFLESDLRTKPKIALRLNKIIYDQIDKDYIKVPSDIHKQIEIVTGGQRVQPSTVSFINYLLDILRPAQLNNNNMNVIDYQTLAYITGLEDCLEQNRKTRFNNRLKEMFTVALQIGIAHSITEQKGKELQSQAVIELNLDYVK